MKYNLHLTGYATACTPIMHVERSDGNRTYAIKATVQYRNQDGELDIVEVPYVQGSSFRGCLRDVMATIIAQKIEERGELLDMATAMRLFNGGQMKSEGVLSLKERRDILDNCPDLRLFGGIAKSMFPSAIRVGSLYPIIDATLNAGIVPASLEKYRQERVIIRNDKPVDILNAWVIQRRHDEIFDGDQRTIRFLSPEAMGEAEKYIEEGIEVQSERKEARQAGEKADVTKTIQKHFGLIQVIPAGTKLFSEIHLVETDLIATGLALLTLQEFLNRPYICSASRSGYGKIALNYDLALEDGTVIKDFIEPLPDGSHAVHVEKWGQDAVNAFNKWAESCTANSLKVA